MLAAIAGRLMRLMCVMAQYPPMLCHGPQRLTPRAWPFIAVNRKQQPSAHGNAPLPCCWRISSLWRLDLLGNQGFAKDTQNRRKHCNHLADGDIRCFGWLSADSLNVFHRGILHICWVFRCFNAAIEMLERPAFHPAATKQAVLYAEKSISVRRYAFNYWRVNGVRNTRPSYAPWSEHRPPMITTALSCHPLQCSPDKTPPRLPKLSLPRKRKSSLPR